MAKKKDLTRREVLKTMGAVAFLAACSDGASPRGADAAAGADSGAADLAAGADADALTQSQTVKPITPNSEHYVTTFGNTPLVDAGTWTLTLLDRGKELGKANLASLNAMPQRTKEHTLECISAGTSNPAISNAIWTGLPLTEILAELKIAVPLGTTWLKGTAADGYTTAFPVSDLDRPVWLVWLMNGEPLPPDHGFPVRVLTPGRYGMKGPKWLTSLEFLDTEYIGFWEQKGWSQDASYRPNAMIRKPESGSTVKAGLMHVAGTAFAGSDPVVSVEVRIDAGLWQDAVIDYAPGADIWTLWHFDWQADKGNHVVQARCTTKSGATSHMSTYGDGAKALIGYNGSMAVSVDVV